MHRANLVRFFVVVLVSAVLITACSQQSSAPTRERKLTVRLSSPAFTEGASIPAKYTCDGENISPPLTWSNPPQSTKSLALIGDDPDAPLGTWVHWVVYGISPSVTELAERVPTTEILPNGARQGTTDFKRIGYGGPCPPAGKPHRYFFKLYALDAELALKPGAIKKDLVDAMAGHILAEGQLIGTYQRK